MGKTIIIGSTPKPYKYAYQAAQMLDERDFEFIPVGIQEGQVLGREIQNLFDKPAIEDVDTITLYINPTRQKEWYNYLLSLKPKRIIFNPGSENQELKNLAEKEGIKCLEACTLVMLSIGNY
ncbi:MAG TPA: CoA-binding protein [Roseivirga sp.]